MTGTGLHHSPQKYCFPNINSCLLSLSEVECYIKESLLLLNLERLLLACLFVCLWCVAYALKVLLYGFSAYS